MASVSKLTTVELLDQLYAETNDHGREILDEEARTDGKWDAWVQCQTHHSCLYRQGELDNRLEAVES